MPNMWQASADSTVQTSGTSASTSVSALPPADAAKQVEILIDYVRANRENIGRTWGTASPQYQASCEIMHKYFSENIKKLNIDVQEASLEDLIAKLSLHEKALPN